MSPALLILLHLPLVLGAEPQLAQPEAASIPPGPMAVDPLPPHLLAPASVPPPRLKSLRQPLLPEQPVLLGEPIWLHAAPFTIQFSDLIKEDHVMVYLDGRRVGSEKAKGPDLGLFCGEPVIPHRGCLLQVFVFRGDAAALPLPPVVVHFRPRRWVEEAVQEPEPVSIGNGRGAEPIKALPRKEKEPEKPGAKQDKDDQPPKPEKGTEPPLPPVKSFVPLPSSEGTPGLLGHPDLEMVRVSQQPEKNNNTTLPQPRPVPQLPVLEVPVVPHVPPATFPPREPFSRTPSVEPVPPAGTITSQSEAGKDGGIADRFYHPGERRKEDWWGYPNENRAAQKFLCHYFDLPAHFPLPQFSDTYNVPAPAAEGVVIHEGMRIFFAEDGRYEVQFAATTPSMLVMLRLQLLVSYLGCGPEPPGYFPLTLPPIRIQPDPDAPGHPETWQVRHVGYSREVQRHFRQLSEVQRSGAARMGSYPRWQMGSYRGSGY